MVRTHLTLRLDTATFHRLQEESQKSGQSRSELARTLLDEGLRMEAHPGIVFRPGPAGRRPGLANGPDVWEIIRIFRELESSGEEHVRQVAELIDLSPEQVRTAVRYYADYQGEIDAWILRADEVAAEAEAAWRRQRELLDT